MKKDRVIKAVLWSASILWMALIFSFSAQDATASLASSDSVLDVIIRIDSFDSLTEKEQTLRCEQLSFYIRKLAHFSVFGILGVLSTTAVSRHTKRMKFTVSISAVICIIYAITDEIHQYFVPGRACRVFDVGIDSVGSICGIIITVEIIYFIRRWRIKLNAKA